MPEAKKAPVSDHLEESRRLIDEMDDLLRRVRTLMLGQLPLGAKAPEKDDDEYYRSTKRS